MRSRCTVLLTYEFPDTNLDINLLCTNVRQCDETSYVDDISALSFEIVYAFEDPDDQISALKVLECLDRHAPLRRTKLTRPPAPWLNEPNILSLQKDAKLNA